MWRRPLRTCNGQIPGSNTQAIPNNLYRSGLGVGISRELKKCPSVIYRPGVGYQKPVCCIIAIPKLRITFDGGSPAASGPKIIDGNGSALIIDGGKP
jgi:hypothetical protein